MDSNKTGTGNIGFFAIPVLQQVMVHVQFDDFVVAADPCASTPMLFTLASQTGLMATCFIQTQQMLQNWRRSRRCQSPSRSKWTISNTLYEPEVFPEGSDLLWAWKWATDHPAEAADIVSRARALADMHLSKLGQICYTVCLFHEYSKLMTEYESMPELLLT
eukprot:jgi/Astpho2/1285/Aster-07129